MEGGRVLGILLTTMYSRGTFPVDSSSPEVLRLRGNPIQEYDN